MNPTQLIYTGCFFKDRYLCLLKSLLETSIKFGKVDFNTTRFLVFTNQALKQKILDLYDELDIKGDIMILDKPIHTVINHSIDERRRMEASASRLHIFDYPEIHKYKKILWLDCDILISNNLNNIFTIDPKNKLNVAWEGNTKAGYWGRWIWDYKGEKNPNTKSFNCGVLYFNNCKEIKNLFLEIVHFYSFDYFKNPAGFVIPACLEQPFINYFAITKNMYNMNLNNIIVHHPKSYEGYTIAHFPGLHSDKNLKKYLKIISKIDSENLPTTSLPYKELWYPPQEELQ